MDDPLDTKNQPVTTDSHRTNQKGNLPVASTERERHASKLAGIGLQASILTLAISLGGSCFGLFRIWLNGDPPSFAQIAILVGFILALLPALFFASVSLYIVRTERSNWTPSKQLFVAGSIAGSCSGLTAIVVMAIMGDVNIVSTESIWICLQPTLFGAGGGIVGACALLEIRKHYCA